MQQLDEKAFIDFAKNVEIRKKARGEVKGCLNPFGEHFTQITTSKLKLSREEKSFDSAPLNLQRYYGRGQYLIENSDLYEKAVSPESFSPAEEIDWDIVSDVHDILATRLKKMDFPFDLKKEAINFTIDAIGNWLIYQQLHPNTANNPWQKIREILNNGFLFLLSDAKEIENIANKEQQKAYKTEQNLLSSPNLAFWSVSQKEVTLHSLESKERIQSILLTTLMNIRDKASSSQQKGEKYASHKTLNALVLEVMKMDNLRIDEKQLSVAVASSLGALKRLGLIASSTKGYFYIQDEVDLGEAYAYMQAKRNQIDRTISAYEIRAKQKSIKLPIYRGTER